MRAGGKIGPGYPPLLPADKGHHPGHRRNRPPPRAALEWNPDYTLKVPPTFKAG